MSVILAFLTSTIGKYIGLAIAALTAFGTAWLAARRAGAKAERAKQAERDAKAVKAADDIEAKNAQLSDAAVKARLKEKWVKL